MSSEGPNVLWICTDQQRGDTLGCYGNRFVRTPSIDELARSGVLFERCYSQSPVCTPSRASFLTGRYPRTTRCRQNGQAIPDDETLISSILAREGYACGLSGKLHVAPCAPRVCRTTERRMEDGYAQFDWSHHPADDWPASGYNQWLREQGVEFASTRSAESEWVSYGMPEEYHQTAWCFERAEAFIRASVRHGRPWLFSLNPFDPHHPFDPPREYLEKYLPVLDEIPLPNYVPGELDDKPVFQRMDHSASYNQPGGFEYERMSERDHRAVRAAYWAMVDLIDSRVERLMNVLADLSVLEETIVIFTSDHGEMLGDHGIYLKGPYFYEPAVHVPLIMSCPGHVKGGRRSPALVELVDLAPSLLDAVGIEMLQGVQGRSLWPMLVGEEDFGRHRSSVYSEYYNAMPFHRDPAAHATMVFDGRHKLVRVHSTDEGELYDLMKDPTETRNLWRDPEHSTVKASMMHILCDRMAFTVDPLPAREGPW